MAHICATRSCSGIAGRRNDHRRRGEGFRAIATGINTRQMLVASFNTKGRFDAAIGGGRRSLRPNDPAYKYLKGVSTSCLGRPSTHPLLIIRINLSLDIAILDRSRFQPCEIKREHATTHFTGPISMISMKGCSTKRNKFPCEVGPRKLEWGSDRPRNLDSVGNVLASSGFAPFHFSLRSHIR
jgi:hypothetical protein